MDSQSALFHHIQKPKKVSALLQHYGVHRGFLKGTFLAEAETVAEVGKHKTFFFNLKMSSLFFKKSIFWSRQNIA